MSVDVSSAAPAPSCRSCIWMLSCYHRREYESMLVAAGHGVSSRNYEVFASHCGKYMSTDEEARARQMIVRLDVVLADWPKEGK